MPAKPLFPEADIEKLKYDLGRPEQFDVNFDYLVRRTLSANQDQRRTAKQTLPA